MGTVVLDAGVLIGFANPTDLHHPMAVEQIRNATEIGHTLTVPASALSEYLVAPARHGATTLAAAVALVRGLLVEVVPLDEKVAVDAAALRASHASLRLPDALVIATARVRRADVLVTTDHGWPSKRALKFAGKLVVV